MFHGGLYYSEPVLVKGLENSCCRSLFSDVLRTTTMSAGRVSLFFSKKPSTLYMTCRAGHKTQALTLSRTSHYRLYRAWQYLSNIIIVIVHDIVNTFTIFNSIQFILYSTLSQICLRGLYNVYTYGIPLPGTTDEK